MAVQPVEEKSRSGEHIDRVNQLIHLNVMPVNLLPGVQSSQSQCFERKDMHLPPLFFKRRR